MPPTIRRRLRHCINLLNQFIIEPNGSLLALGSAKAHASDQRHMPHAAVVVQHVGTGAEAKHFSAAGAQADVTTSQAEPGRSPDSNLLASPLSAPVRCWRQPHGAAGAERHRLGLSGRFPEQLCIRSHRPRGAHQADRRADRQRVRQQSLALWLGRLYNLDKFAPSHT